MVGCNAWHRVIGRLPYENEMKWGDWTGCVARLGYIDRGKGKVR